MWVHEAEGLYFERGTDINTLGIAEQTRHAAQDFRIQVMPTVTDCMCAAVFDMPASGWLKLTVYDITGRSVDEVYCGAVGQGRQTIDVPVSHLSNGTYFVVLETTTSRQTAKFVIAR